MTQSKRIYAITGGIGSGKSLAAQIIAQHGYAVFSCDEIYADITKGGKMVEELENTFKGVTLADGSLDRKALSKKVLNDASALEKLNKITHPAIMKRLFALAENASVDVVFCEVPLLFESRLENFFSGVIVVLRDREERINAVIKRSNLSMDEVLARMKNQFDYDNNDLSGYYILHNDGDIASLKEKIIKILKNIAKLA